MYCNALSLEPIEYSFLAFTYSALAVLVSFVFTYLAARKAASVATSVELMLSSSSSGVFTSASTSGSTLLSSPRRIATRRSSAAALAPIISSRRIAISSSVISSPGASAFAILRAVHLSLSSFTAGAIIPIASSFCISPDSTCRIAFIIVVSNSLYLTASEDSS